ncbi:MAG: MAPEG family protein [Alphaproteobacteria bacterium]
MLIQTTLIYAGVLGLLLVILSFNVMQNWVRVTGEGQQTDRDMRRAERVLSSFVEYVPMTLILLAMIELKGTPPLILHILGGSLVLARILHAYGSNDVAGSGALRFLGSQLTFLILMVVSLACIYYFGFARV